MLMIACFTDTSPSLVFSKVGNGCIEDDTEQVASPPSKFLHEQEKDTSQKSQTPLIQHCQLVFYYNSDMIGDWINSSFQLKYWPLGK